MIIERTLKSCPQFLFIGVSSEEKNNKTIDSTICPLLCIEYDGHVLPMLASFCLSFFSYDRKKYLMCEKGSKMRIDAHQDLRRKERDVEEAKRVCSSRITRRRNSRFIVNPNFRRALGIIRWERSSLSFSRLWDHYNAPHTYIYELLLPRSFFLVSQYEPSRSRRAEEGDRKYLAKNYVRPLN